MICVITLHVLFDIASLTLGRSHDCLSASEGILIKMGKRVRCKTTKNVAN